MCFWGGFSSGAPVIHLSGWCRPLHVVLEAPSFLLLFFAVYYRALVNFTTSIEYSPDLDNVSSDQFRDLSEAIVDTVRVVRL